MARTKKTTVIESAEVAESVKPKTTKAKKVASKVIEKAMTEPTVVVGSHLTVTTYPDGRTELKWDDEALARDVRLAILSAESRISVTEEIKPAVKAKALTRSKKVKNEKR